MAEIGVVWKILAGLVVVGLLVVVFSSDRGDEDE